jgi:hypothetical protein
MMARVSEPEMPRAASGTYAKTAEGAETPHFQHFDTATASQDRLECVNAADRGQAILGTVTHPSHGVLPENQDQPHGTEDQRA